METAKDIETLIKETEEIASKAKNSFGNLNNIQLNWKPAAEKWSVAQCLEHLLTTNEAYFSTFDAIARGEKKTRIVERLPLFPTIFGNLLKRSVDPAATRKLKAPGKIQPTNSNLDSTVLPNFIEQQQSIIRHMNTLKKMELEKIIVTSPVLSLITYSLMDAFRIIVAHEQRHLIQASNVVAEESFPR